MSIRIRLEYEHKGLPYADSDISLPFYRLFFCHIIGIYVHEQLDGCIVWNAHNTVLGEEALLIYIVPVCYVKTGRHRKT